MLGTDFFVFLLVMVLAIILLFVMVWHVSIRAIDLQWKHGSGWVLFGNILICLLEPIAFIFLLLSDEYLFG